MQPASYELQAVEFHPKRLGTKEKVMDITCDNCGHKLIPVQEERGTYMNALHITVSGEALEFFEGEGSAVFCEGCAISLVEGYLPLRQAVGYYLNPSFEETVPNKERTSRALQEIERLEQESVLKNELLVAQNELLQSNIDGLNEYYDRVEFPESGGSVSEREALKADLAYMHEQLEDSYNKIENISTQLDLALDLVSAMTRENGELKSTVLNGEKKWN